MITAERLFVQSGVFQVLEQGVVSQCPMYQLPMVAGALVSSFDLSQSNQMLAFGDTCGEYRPVFRGLPEPNRAWLLVVYFSR